MILMKGRFVCKSVVRMNDGGDEDNDEDNEPPIWIEVHGY